MKAWSLIPTGLEYKNYFVNCSCDSDATSTGDTAGPNLPGISGQRVICLSASTKSIQEPVAGN